jgi:hypothetical protein
VSPDGTGIKTFIPGPDLRPRAFEIPRRPAILPIGSRSGVEQILTLEQSPNDPEHRVLPFRARQPVRRPSDSGSPVEDLKRFERPDGDDDFRHRMWMNVLAFGFLALLVGGGIWVADSIATLRKNQDCVLSGRRGCNQFDTPAAGSLTPNTAKVAPASRSPN